MENTELEDAHTDTTASELFLLNYLSQINMRLNTKPVSSSPAELLQISLDSGSDTDKNVT